MATGFYWSLVFIECLSLAVCYVHVVNFTQTSPSYSPVCPGDTVVFACITNGTGSAVWRLNGTGLIFVDNVTHMNVHGSLTIKLVNIIGTKVISSGAIESVSLSLNGVNVSCSATLQEGIQLPIDISGVPDAVSNVTIIPSTNSSVVLSWSPVHCVVNYTITVLSSNIDVRVETTNTTSVAIDNLTVGINYSFTVAASDTIGRVGPSSFLLNYTWNVPVQVQNVNWLQVSANTIFISWTVVEDTHPTNLYYLIITDPILLNTAINTTDTAVNITGLSFCEVYTIKINAVNIIGAGPVASVNVSVVSHSSVSSATVFMDTTSFPSLMTTLKSSTPLSGSVLQFNTKSNSATTSLPVTTSVSNTPLSTAEENTSVYPIAGTIGGVVMILTVTMTLLVAILIYRKRNCNSDIQASESEDHKDIELPPDPTYTEVNADKSSVPIYDLPAVEQEMIDLHSNTAYGHIKQEMIDLHSNTAYGHIKQEMIDLHSNTAYGTV